jgi:hypothetical protein
VRDCYDSGSKKLKAAFQSRLVSLAQLDFHEWQGVPFKVLHGECAGLGEIRFKADGVQQRPIGFRSGAAEFTILLWAREKGDKFIPRDSCTKAQKRKNKVSADRTLTDAIWIALE